jgi:hypothetical protein
MKNQGLPLPAEVVTGMVAYEPKEEPARPGGGLPAIKLGFKGGGCWLAPKRPLLGAGCEVDDDDDHGFEKVGACE